MVAKIVICELCDSSNWLSSHKIYEFYLVVLICTNYNGKNHFRIHDKLTALLILAFMDELPGNHLASFNSSNFCLDNI